MLAEQFFIANYVCYCRSSTEIVSSRLKKFVGFFFNSGYSMAFSNNVKYLLIVNGIQVLVLVSSTL